MCNKKKMYGVDCMSVEDYRRYRNKSYRDELPWVVKEFWDTKPSEKQEDLSYRRSVRSFAKGALYTFLLMGFVLIVVIDHLI